MAFQCSSCKTSFSIEGGDGRIPKTCPFCGKPLNAGRKRDEPVTISDESAFDTGPIEPILVDHESSYEHSDSQTIRSINPMDLEVIEQPGIRLDETVPEILPDDHFYFCCPVCESNLHASLDQIGEKTTCSDCFSEVEIKQPPESKKRKDLWRRPQSLKASEDDDLKLEDPVELPTDENVIGDDMGLEQVGGDLLSAPIDAEVVAPNPEKSSGPNVRTDPVETAGSSVDQSDRFNPKAEGAGEVAKIRLQQYFDLELATDIDLLIRTAVSIIFLAFGYAMLDYVWSVFGDSELNGGDKFVAVFPSLIGAFVCFSVGFWFVSVTAAVLVGSIASGFEKIENWLGFGPSEWMGSFFLIAFSSWSASVPGGIFGYIVWKLTGIYFLFPLFMFLTGFVLAPIFLIGAFQNESPIRIFSESVISSIGTHQSSWLEFYKWIGGCLGLFLLGAGILFVPGILFSFIGAAIQVVAVTLFAITTGIHGKNLPQNA